MRRTYAVIKFLEASTLDPTSDEDSDELADDMLRVVHGVASFTVLPTLAELSEEQDASWLRYYSLRSVRAVLTAQARIIVSAPE